MKIVLLVVLLCLTEAFAAGIVERRTGSPCCQGEQSELSCSKIYTHPESWRCTCSSTRRNLTEITIAQAVNLDLANVLVNDVLACVTHVATLGIQNGGQGSELRMLRITGNVGITHPLILRSSVEFPALNSSLQIIALKGIGVQAVQPGFFNMFHGSLETLEMDQNNITRLREDTFQSNLTNLQRLSLDGNQISEISKCTFVGMPELKELILSRNRINLVHSETFSALSRLRTLDLTGNQIQKVDSFTFAGLYSLNKLQLDYNNIIDVDFSKILTCNQTRITENCTQEVLCKVDSWPLKKLKKLMLSNNAINSTSSLKLSAAKAVTELDIRSNKIGNFSFDQFTTLCKLKRLNVSYNSITVIEARLNASAEKCRKLEVSFAGNRIHNLSLSDIRGEQRISSLDFSNNFLTEANGGMFEGLSRLSRLDLSDNRISSFDSFKLAGLETLNLESNLLETFSPMWLFSLLGNNRGKIRLGDNPLKCDKNLVELFEQASCNEVSDREMYSASSVAQLNTLSQVFDDNETLTLPLPGVCTVIGHGKCKPRITTSMNKCLLRAYLDLASESSAAQNVNIFDKLLGEIEQLYIYARAYVRKQGLSELKNARIQLVQAVESISERVRMNIGGRLTGNVNKDVVVGLMEISRRRTRLPPTELGFHIDNSGTGNFLSDHGASPIDQRTTRTGVTTEYCKNPDVSFPKLADYSEMNIALPLAVYERIRTHIQRVSFVVYKDKFLFPSNATVMSSVISAELPQVNTQGLSSPIVITANVKLPDNSSLNLIKCSFWNFTTLSWRSEGCEVANISSSVDERGYSTITCHCNHLTNFAVLLNHDTRENPTVEDNEITELISYAGIIASIIGLSITIIFRLSRREFRRGVPQIILLHLCFCLLIVYIMMLIYDKSFVVQHMGSCFLVGFLMHYFLLSSWGWCLTEGVSMYLLLVQVYNVNLRRFLTKATICCYGAASLLVCGSLILSGSSADVAEHPGYIVLDAYRYGDACVVTYPNSLYFVIIPIAVACSLNLVCFVFVIKGLRQTAASDGMGGTKKKNMVKHRLRQAVCVTTLLGVTWCIGFVKVALQSSFGTTSDVVWAFEILFSAVNSVQGFVIFLMFCAANLWSEFRCTTGPDKKRGRLYSQTSKLGSTSNEKVAAVTATTHQSSTA
nr:uncharacterized protein LOC100176382 [Ciona intestinalis]|eukprot:XP_002127022.3 uncharacterized protein LOC100176382 [Ciona intestinalis]